MKDTNHKIREALQTNVPAWDKEEVWQNIEPKLPPEKSKRRFVIWWWFSGLAVFGGVLFFAWQGIAEQERIQTELPSGQSSEKMQSPDVVRHLPERLPDARDTRSSNEKGMDQVMSDNNMTVRETPFSAKNPSFAENKNKNRAESAEKTTAPSIQMIPLQAGHTKKSETVDNQVYAAGQTAVDVPGQPADKNSATVPAATPLPGRMLLFLTNDIPSLQPVLPDTKTGYWMFAVEGGIADLDKTATVMDPVATNWSNLRNNITSPKESLYAGIRFFRFFPNGFSIGSGLLYQRIQEVVSAKDVIQTIRDIPSDSAFYYTGVSGTEYFSGNIREIRTTGFSVYSPNVLTRWTIPLEVGYSLPVGKLAFTPSAGILYTIYQQYEGIHPGPDEKLIYKNRAATETMYKITGQLSWSAALDVRLFAKGSVEAGLGVFYSRDITSSLRTELHLDERFIQKGIRFRLLKKL
jgi:hypothetical protein